MPDQAGLSARNSEVNYSWPGISFSELSPLFKFNLTYSL
jgi:hypothetical protein